MLHFGNDESLVTFSWRKECSSTSNEQFLVLKLEAINDDPIKQEITIIFYFRNFVEANAYGFIGKTATDPREAVELVYMKSVEKGGRPKGGLEGFEDGDLDVEGHTAVGTSLESDGLARENLETELQRDLAEMEFLRLRMAELELEISAKETLFNELSEAEVKEEKCEGLLCFIRGMFDRITGLGHPGHGKRPQKGHCGNHTHGNHTHGNHTFPHPPWWPPHHPHGNHTHGNHSFPRPPFKPPHFCRCPPGKPHHPPGKKPPHRPDEPHHPPVDEDKDSSQRPLPVFDPIPDDPDVYDEDQTVRALASLLTQYC